MENSIDENIIILEQLIIANENCIKNAKNKDNPFVAIWEKQNKAIDHILLEYKRVLKENEEINKKYDKDTHILQNELDYANADRIDLAQQNKELRKENEGLKIKNNAIKRESEAYAENMIRLDNELNLEKEKSKYEWIRQNCLPQELVNRLYIPIQKVKDKIEELDKKVKDYQCVENRINLYQRKVLQELLEESEE